MLTRAVPYPHWTLTKNTDNKGYYSVFIHYTALDLLSVPNTSNSTVRIRWGAGCNEPGGLQSRNLSIRAACC